MNTAKKILKIAGLYLATIAAAVAMIFVALLLLSPQSCSDYSRAAAVIWVVTALLFLASAVGAGLLSRRLFVGVTARVITVILYAVAMLLSYILIAISVLVGFNC